MDLVNCYNRLNKHRSMPLLTISSAFQKIFGTYIGQPFNEDTKRNIADALTEVMHIHGFDRKYIVKIVGDRESDSFDTQILLKDDYPNWRPVTWI